MTLDGSPESIAARAGGKSTAYAASSSATKVHDFLSAETWVARDLPPPDRLLGDIVTKTTRLFLVGQTGLGKTMFGFGMACGIATGAGFLHWRSARPARVLYIDGEMASELVKARLLDALKRITNLSPPGNLTIFAQDMEEEFAEAFPTLGKMGPLNTEAGQNFIMALIDAIGGIDVVVFDNVMSLVSGDQKDEIPWSETLPLVARLTRAKVGQVWLDHTGHDTSRQYGSSTKAWRFDTVGILSKLPAHILDGADLGFSLSFEHPGKARRRTPKNWQDYSARVIRLQGDVWTSQSQDGAQAEVKLKPAARAIYAALMDALAVTDTPGRCTKASWYTEAARVGLVDALDPSDDRKQKDRKMAKFRKQLAEIKIAGLVGINGEDVIDLRKP